MDLLRDENDSRLVNTCVNTGCGFEWRTRAQGEIAQLIIEAKKLAIKSKGADSLDLLERARKLLPQIVYPEICPKCKRRQSGQNNKKIV